MKQPRHLPYSIDSAHNRFHRYETLWKERGLELLQRHLPASGQSVLDYGCGRGEALELFKNAGYRPTGTDADPECVRLSSAYGPATLLDLQSPLSQFGEKSFDAVICFHVLEHVECPRAVLSTLSRIARSHIVLAVPYLQTLRNVFRRNPVIGEVNEGHLQSWDHAHFQSLAERHCGLRLLEWMPDAVILPVFNRLAPLIGLRGITWLETRVFPRLFPTCSQSVLGIFQVSGSLDATEGKEP